MSPFTILPVLLPLIGGILMLMARPAGIDTQRILSLILTTLLVGVSLVSFQLANSDIYQVVLLGNWQAPFGIVIVLESFIGTDVVADVPTVIRRIMVCHSY